MNSTEITRFIIVDDESKSRQILQHMIETYCPNLDCCATAENVAEAVRHIKKFNPDLVFLDIDMPGISGLQLLDFFNPEEITFSIIFVTAYSEYAVEAFRLSAIDYLLKPVQIEHLTEAVEKAVQSGKKQRSASVESLKINLTENTSFYKIAVPVSDGLLFVNTQTIMYLKASGAYCEFHLADGSSILVSKNLKEFEKLLTLSHFVRPHRSYIVNLQFLKQLQRKDGGYLIMDDGCSIHVTPTAKEDVFAKIDALK
jgi:two-component system LytT family response regulator